MGKNNGRWTNWALNAALLVLGLGVLVLVYGFVTRAARPAEETSPEREENPAQLVGEIIQVDVRNGVGVSGLAAQATRYLRDRGFDVVESGNYVSFDQEESVVLDRVGNPEAARKVAAALGLPEDRVRQEIQQDYYLDASVVIGSDYRTLDPFEDEQ